MLMNKLTYRVIIIAAIVAATAPIDSDVWAEVLIPAQSVWKYYVDNQYPASGWQQSDYDDSSWPSGEGILGYGESYITTEIPYGGDPSNKYITTCFRIHFNIAIDPQDINSLTLRTNFDDGFVAYLNDFEVTRQSMPAGEILYSTTAFSHESGVYEGIDLTPHTSQLELGQNTLAVEVHQTNATSSDLAWDAELVASTSDIQFIWSGSVTSHSARVKAKSLEDEAIIRLVFSEQPDLSSPEYSSPDTADPANNNIVDLQVSGLSAATQYFYAPESDGLLDLEQIGRFRTFPTDTATFTIAFASCASTGSNHPVFQTIVSHNPLFFLHTGDFHYENIAVNDPSLYQSAYETVLASPNQSQMHKHMPIEYIWDDHDYGPNNSDSTAPGREAARLTYQQYVPHYPLSAGTGDIPIYHTFDVGRIRFIVCDMRSARSPYTAPDNSEKTMMGVEQKQWFKDQLLDADSTAPLIVWVNSLPWIGVTGDDGWYLYTMERHEIAQFISDNRISRLCMLSADAHMLAIDDGTNSDYSSDGGAGFPVMHAAALDRSGSVKGGPYSHGAYPGGGQFGLMTVRDTGDSVHVEWSGRNYQDQEIVAYSFSYSGLLDYVCGDANTSGVVDIDDVVYIIGYIFAAGPSPNPIESADVDCSGSVDIDDIMYLVNYIFGGGSEPCSEC
jgi:hypothetical protein